MKNSVFSLAVTSLAACASASESRVRGDTPKKAFTLTQIQNAHYQAVDAPTAFIRIHAKYSEALDPRIKDAIRKNPELNHKFKSMIQEDDQDSTVEATPPSGYDSEYVINVDLGTPPQTIAMNIDTGSSDFWTLSSDTYEPLAKGHTLYHPENSTTSQKLDGESWNIHYGDGAGASGIVYTDRVQIGNIEFDKQAIESAITVSEAIAADTFSSGIIGLAAGFANTVRPNKQKTFMENVLSDLDKPLFTANLQKGRPGDYTFGEIDESAYEGDIQYALIDTHVPYWHYMNTGYQIGNDSSDFKDRGWDAIADTGTTLLLAPDDIVTDYYQHVDGSAYDLTSAMFVFPCNATVPDFVFGVGPYRGVIPGDYMRYAQVNAEFCFGGIQSSKGIPFSIVGDILLKAQFVVFDYGTQPGVEGRRIGFAKKPLM